MAFVGLQGQLPQFGELQSQSQENWLPRPRLALAHLTSVPPFIKDFKGAIQAHEIFTRVALSNPNVKAILNAGDLDGISTVHMGLLFGLQRTPAAITYADLHTLFTAGVRTMAIAYDGDTEYGGGFKSGGRLKGRGERLIEWMAKIGIILDLSHAGHSTARGALRFIAQERLPMKPMLSHSGCFSIYEHPRNVPNDLLKDVAELDGYCGIPLITFFLGRKDSVPFIEFSRHVTHALSVMGKGKVGIGSDCNHLDMTMEQAKEHYVSMTRMLKTDGSFGEYFPDRPQDLIEHGSTMFPVIKSKLQKGNTLVLDPNILGQNFKEFLSRSLPQV